MRDVMKGEVLAMHEDEISWEMSGGGDVAANVGSEQNTRATGTALAFTMTQAHLFTTPLTFIARLARACTSTVSFTTAWFRLGAVVAYRLIIPE
jgi:hypothetical protein